MKRKGKYNFKFDSRKFRKLGLEVKNEAHEWTQKAFERGGFSNKGFEAWKPRKRKDKRRPGRALLVDTSIMKNSTKGRLRKKQSGFAVVVSSPRRYAARHNYGLRGMPKRKFVGRSARLEKRILIMIKKALR